jgi:hypothetical protein
MIPFAQEWEWSPLIASLEWQDAPRTTIVRRTWRYTEKRVPFMRGELRVRGARAVSQDEGPPRREGTGEGISAIFAA